MITNQKQYEDATLQERSLYNQSVINRLDIDSDGDVTNLEMWSKHYSRFINANDVSLKTNRFHRIKPEPTPEEEFKAYCKENKFEVGKEIVSTANDLHYIITDIDSNTMTTIFKDNGATRVYSLKQFKILKFKLYEPEFRAFRDYMEAQDCLGRTIQARFCPCSYLITAVSDRDIHVVTGTITFKNAFEKYDFIDLGTKILSPIGIKL